MIVPLDCNGLNLMPSLTARDLGIYFSDDLKFDQHIDYIVKSAHYLCHVIFKAFVTRDEEHLKKLFVTYVRPKLEFATQIWCSYFKKDISKIERVKQLYIKRLPTLTNLKYEDRLNKLQLSSLEDRRHKFDFVFLYKIIHGMTSHLDLPSLNIHPSTGDRVLRGSGHTLQCDILMTSRTQHSFFVRALNLWNNLPRTSNSLSFNQFKNFISLES